VRLRRGSPTKGLEFELRFPEGLNIDRDVPGTDLVVSVGPHDHPAATAITVAADRDGAPVTLGDHVSRVRERSAGMDPHLVDEGPATLAGLEGWWTFDAIASDGRSLILERWMLVRDGVGWTVSVRMPWLDVPRLRDGALAIVSTLEFR
jgi:hypothetical protein